MPNIPSNAINRTQEKSANKIYVREVSSAPQIKSKSYKIKRGFVGSSAAADRTERGYSKIRQLPFFQLFSLLKIFFLNLTPKLFPV